MKFKVNYTGETKIYTDIDIYLISHKKYILKLAKRILMSYRMFYFFNYSEEWIDKDSFF